MISLDSVPSPVRISEDGSTVHLLDQRRLPGEECVRELTRPEDVAEAIRTLQVRGAPAIGIAAAYGLSLGFRPGQLPPGADPEAHFVELRSLFLATRPTAVNLRWAVDRVGAVVERVSGAEGPESGGLHGAVLEEARAIHREDARACEAIGEHAQSLLPSPNDIDARRPLGILTHCNAGALATGGIGTALAPVYTAHARGLPLTVFAGETRPVLQGARLTAWELSRAGVPVSVHADSMAAALMASGKVGLVFVGADRIAANGDVANKIGTYGLALLAREHGIPFYVAAPRSTLDPKCPSGSGIPIEERSEDELRAFNGEATVPTEAAVWNPAFDVTPAHLVTAIITEDGVFRPPYRTTLVS